MSRENSDGDDSGTDPTSDAWMFDRRRALQLGGAGIAGLGLIGGGAGVASAATNCADGPFERAYTGGSVVFSEIPSPEGQSEQADVETGPMPTRPAYSEPLTDAEREAVKRLGEPSGAQRADPAGPAAKRPDADDGNGIQIGTEYDGINAEGTRGGVPSDSQIATGSEYNLHAVNQQVAMFEKQSGDQELKVRLEDIWEPVIPTPEGGFVGNDYPFVFDPRARYDRNEDRYILAAVQSVQGIDEDGSVITREEIEEGADGPGFEDEEGEEGGEEETDPGPNPPDPRPPRGFLLVAVSATSDPTGKWYVYRLPPEDADGPDNLGLVDYPELGFDTDAVYLSQNFFPNADDPNQSVRPTIVSLDKAQLYSGNAVTAYHFDNLDNPTDDYQDFTVQPAAQPFSGGSDGTYHFLNSVFRNTMATPLATTLTQWELTDPTDDPTLRCFTVEVDPYTGPPPAQQPDSEKFIDTLGRRLMNLDYNAETGSLWAAHATAVSWDGVTIRSAIRWYEVNANSRSLVQSGTYGEPEESYFIPTVNSDGDSTMIVHNVSGPNTFPRMDAAGRTADFSQNVLEDAVIVEDGETRYDYGEGMPVMRWGDYNGLSVDPETGKYWGVSQYSPDINIDPARETRDPYHTRIAELSFDQGNTLRVEGSGEYAFYSFRTTGGIELTSTPNQEDRVRQNTASGAVGGGTDTYTFTDDLRNLYVQQGATVFVNGEDVDPDDYESVVSFRGDGSTTTYNFEVKNGQITGTNGLSGEDSVSESSASGAVAGGSDTYTFTGTFRGLDTDGSAMVVLNGQSVDPSLFYNTITFKGQGSRASYDFTTTGEVKDTAGLTGEDSVNEGSVSGAIRGGSDTYVYSGTLDDLNTDGSVVVTRNGEVVTEGDN